MGYKNTFLLVYEIYKLYIYICVYINFQMRQAVVLNMPIKATEMYVKTAKLQRLKGCETEATGYCPYQRSLESVTICSCH